MGFLLKAIIGLFLGSKHFIFKILNIRIGSIILEAISKNSKVFRLVNSIVTLFNQSSNLISTFKSNKLFNLFNIKVIINTFSIKRQDLIFIKLTLERKVFMIYIRTTSKIINVAQKISLVIRNMYLIP